MNKNHNHKTAIVGNVKDAPTIIHHSTLTQQTLQTAQCSRSSAGYYVNMNEMIGKRPVYTPHFNECHVPAKVVSTIKEHRDTTCKTPMWNKTCI